MYKEYKDHLDLNEVLTQLLKNDSDSCELTYTHGDLVFTLDLTITKIVKNGKVEYDIEERTVDKDEFIEKVRKEKAKEIFYKAERKSFFQDGGYYGKDRRLIDIEELKQIIQKEYGVEID